MKTWNSKSGIVAWELALVAIWVVVAFLTVMAP